MKKLIFLTILLISSIAYAENNIPGFLELDLNYERFLSFKKDKQQIANTEIKLKYGENFEWFQPIQLYAFASWKTFFEYENLTKDYPYRDIYGWGLGFKIKIFYFEYEKRCSHSVFSSSENGDKYYTLNEKNYLLFEGMPTVSYHSFKVGIKVKID